MFFELGVFFVKATTITGCFKHRYSYFNKFLHTM